jgi:hypothetical protein
MSFSIDRIDPFGIFMDLVINGQQNEIGIDLIDRIDRVELHIYILKISILVKNHNHRFQTLRACESGWTIALMFCPAMVHISGFLFPGIRVGLTVASMVRPAGTIYRVSLMESAPES